MTLGEKLTLREAMRRAEMLVPAFTKMDVIEVHAQAAIAWYAEVHHIARPDQQQGACEECGNDDPCEGYTLCSDCLEATT